MEKLVCSGCGASLSYQPGTRVLKCAYCGAEHVLGCQNGEDASGIQEIRNENGVLFTSYVPYGWRTVIAGSGEESLRSMVVPMIGFFAPDNKAVIRFKGTAVFRHIDANNRLMQQNQLDPSMQIRYRTFQTASEYCDAVFQQEHPMTEYSVKNSPLSSERANALKGYQERLLRTAGPNMEVYTEFVERIYAYGENGNRRRCAISVTIGAWEPKQPQQASAASGGLFGALAGFVGNMVRPAKEWERPFELLLDAEEDRFEQYYQDYLQVDRTLAPAQGYYDLVNQMAQKARDTQNYVANVRMDMANRRMQASQRMAQTINQTQNEIYQMQRETFQNQQASRDRIDTRWNEALRGVNSYYTADGPIEVSNRFDHVYRSNENPDLFVGTEGGTLDSPFFDELTKRE